MSYAAFPTTFPADAASKIGQAILSRTFTRDLVEPLYDLIGFGLFKLFGSAAPDTPTPPTPAPVAKLLSARPADEEDIERVGHMLNSAVEMHGRALKGSHDLLMPLPWTTILGVLVTILQGILLGAEPAPVNPAQQ